MKLTTKNEFIDSFIGPHRTAAETAEELKLDSLDAVKQAMQHAVIEREIATAHEDYEPIYDLAHLGADAPGELHLPALAAEFWMKANS